MFNAVVLCALRSAHVPRPRHVPHRTLTPQTKIKSTCRQRRHRLRLLSTLKRSGTPSLEPCSSSTNTGNPEFASKPSWIRQLKTCARPAFPCANLLAKSAFCCITTGTAYRSLRATEKCGFSTSNSRSTSRFVLLTWQAGWDFRICGFLTVRRRPFSFKQLSELLRCQRRVQVQVQKLGAFHRPQRSPSLTLRHLRRRRPLQRLN